MKVVIKEIRKKSGITLEELATKTGIEVTVLSELEENNLDICNAKMLTKIAEVLGVQISDIFFY